MQQTLGDWKLKTRSCSKEKQKNTTCLILVVGSVENDNSISMFYLLGTKIPDDAVAKYAMQILMPRESLITHYKYNKNHFYLVLILRQKPSR